MTTLAFSHVPIMADNPKTESAARREIKTERKNYVFKKSIADMLMDLVRREGGSENDLVAKAIEKEARSVPLLGFIPCGPMAEIPEDSVEDWINVGDLLKPKAGDFLLTARGSSMTGDGIQDGDLVLIRPQQHCDSGEIAAVMVDTPVGPVATLKKVEFRIGNPIVKLVPMNPDNETIEIDTSTNELRICGVKRTIIRMH